MPQTYKNKEKPFVPRTHTTPVPRNTVVPVFPVPSTSLYCTSKKFQFQYTHRTPFIYTSACIEYDVFIIITHNRTWCLTLGSTYHNKTLRKLWHITCKSSYWGCHHRILCVFLRNSPPFSWRGRAVHTNPPPPPPHVHSHLRTNHINLVAKATAVRQQHGDIGSLYGKPKSLSPQGEWLYKMWCEWRAGLHKAK